MADVFISYSRVVRDATLELAGRLWQEGYTTWIDAKLNADQLFQQVIDAEVDAAKAVVTIWSAPALKSRWVRYESHRALRQDKLICTHTPDVDPADLPADFYGINCVPVSDFTTIFNTLISRNCRPAEKTEAELPEEHVLEREALREWRDGVATCDDPDMLRAFIQKYERARVVRDEAQRRLRRTEARAALRTRTGSTTESERAIQMFEAISAGSDPDEFSFFMRKHGSAQPELAFATAERLVELDPERLLSEKEHLPDRNGEVGALVTRAEDAIRLRETPPEEAILRLDPGMHTAVIRRISVTADGRMLATASHDKTVRLWALPDPGSEPGTGGRLIRTLRPAIGAGDEGKVYAVALAPDGRWAALGGWDKGASPQNPECFVTLFDTQTGAVITRLGPLANVVLDLEVSPDGARLAAGLGGQGVRVWDVTPLAPVRGRGAGGEGGGAPVPASPPSPLPLSRPGGRGEPLLLWSDEDYGDSVYGLAFARDGRLATTCDDGRIRLYPADGGRPQKAKAPAGAQPSGVAFSPDGVRLAVGYYDTTRVDRLDAADLSPLGEVDTAGVTDGNLGPVAFLADGRLAAAGRHTAGGRCPIFLWADGGRGACTAWRGPENTVMDLAALPAADGPALTGARLAFGAGDPAFGLFAEDGAPALFRGPAIADMSGKLAEHFLISADGRLLRFGLKQRSAAPALFDLAERVLAPAPDAPGDLVQADVGGLTIENWINHTEPTLKTGDLLGGESVTLALEPYEMSRSLAVAPDAKSFVLGAEWSLRRFDAKGEPLWEQPVPDVVWGVHLAREGRLIVAAYGDGTIRWHRASDGEELLALFIHLPEGTDGPPESWEWVLFTPKGYYQASSPEAESIIGWHVNRGADQAADFYPADSFASTFKKPEMIDAALEGV